MASKHEPPLMGGFYFMVFSDVANLDGLIQECERITQLGVAGISGSTNLLKAFTARINQALDRFAYLSLMGDGRWQVDDTNATDFPIGTTNLVSGQQDYQFASDVLVVNKVLAKNSQGTWGEIYPVDVAQTENNIFALNTWQLPANDIGTPRTYDKFGNSILLDPIPNYNSTGGLKVVFSRNFIKFAYTDTSTSPGIPSLFHGYLSLCASYPFCRDNGKTNAVTIKNDIIQMEDAIQEFYSKRDKDTRTMIIPARRTSR